jgi:hypothetical protein
VGLITGLDLSSIEMTVNGTTLDLTSPCVTYDEITGRLELLTGCAGIVFADRDSVNVCVSGFDTPDHCAPNESEFCWWFRVSLSPPDPGPITYVPGTWVSCDTANQAILLSIIDSDGIDLSTILLVVEDVEYRWGAPELSWVDDSVLIFTPLDATTYFWNAQMVDVCLMEVTDLLGNALETPLCWSFEMDLSAPAIWGPVPLPDTVLNDSLAIISIFMWDSLTGIDPSTIYLDVDGMRMNLSNPCLIWNPAESLLTFDISCLDSAWIDWDTVVVTVGACDSPDTCAPNCDERSWVFYVRLTGPAAEIITPQPGEITACDDQCIELRLWDDWEGVDVRTVVFVINTTDTFRLGTPGAMLTYTAIDSTLRFCPDRLTWRSWANEEVVRVELISAFDSLGNPLRTPIDYTFSVDLRPPVPFGITLLLQKRLQCSILSSSLILPLTFPPVTPLQYVFLSVVLPIP